MADWDDSQQFRHFTMSGAQPSTQTGFTCIRSCLAKTVVFGRLLLQSQRPKGFLLGYPKLQGRAAISTALKEDEWILSLENFITIAFFCQGVLNQTEGIQEEVMHSLQCKIPYLQCCLLVSDWIFHSAVAHKDWQTAVLLSEQHFVSDRNPHVHDLNSDVN